ncbi:MarR family winged helix-turn-helix transcriptional regulator [Modestobacter sp. SSW1-42]|uniref:MarR family winged helix-turn-helix transcriptional regulator n=1 Tax=Modestobacter sp. SSW1-42 TaxID=596372 RepID=UPI0039860D3A
MSGRPGATGDEVPAPGLSPGDAVGEARSLPVGGSGPAGEVAADGPPGAAVPALEAEMADLWRRSRARVRVLARQVRPGLDPAAYPLVVLLATRGPLRSSELGAALELDKSTVSRQVDSVVRLGLAERSVDSADARARLVGLTEDGRTRAGQLREEQLARWRASLSTWSEDDVRRLTALLSRLGRTGLT